MVALLATGCNGEEKGNGTLKIEPAEITDVPYPGKEYSISVDTKAEWSTADIPEWVELSRTHGTGEYTITAKVLRNPGATRNAEIKFSAGTIEKSLKISQVNMPLPDAAGNIIGEDNSDIPTELRVREIDGAETYRWYLDGMAVANGPEATFLAEVTGTYKVAGVNSAGEGPHSPEKYVYITPDEDLFINKLVGEWKVTGYFISSTNMNTMYDNIHTLSIRKTSSTTVQITNFAGDDAYNSDVKAEVNNEAQTITIKHPQEFIPSWMEGTGTNYRTFMCPLILGSPYTGNFGLSFPAIKINEDDKGVLSLKLYTGSFINFSGVVFNGSYTILFTDSQAKSASSMFRSYLNIVWEKL